MVFQQASSLPTTYCCFRSPSGNGLKILVQVSSGASQHEQAFRQIAASYEAQLQVPIDRSGKDVSRLCFYSADPALYLNSNSQPFELMEEPEAQPGTEEPAQATETDYTELFQKAVDFTQNKATYVDGSRNKFVFLLASNCNRNGIPGADALQLILRDFNYNEPEVKASVMSAYKNKAEFGKYARLAQKDVVDEEEKEDFSEKLLNTPYVPEEVYQQLPQLLQEGCQHFQHPRERDLFLTGALTILSGCMKGVLGTYDQRTVYPNLFSFAIAPAASGKSALSFAKELAMTNHRK